MMTTPAITTHIIAATGKTEGWLLTAVVVVTVTMVWDILFILIFVTPRNCRAHVASS